MPARLLSDLLGIMNLTSFKIEHYRGAHKDPIATIRYPLVADVTGERVLLVDDVSDSGDTFRVALAHIRERGTPATLRTAVLHHKTASPLVPDYYGAKVIKWRWLIYPWAVTEDLTEFARSMDPQPEDLATLRNRLQEDYGLSPHAAKLVDVMANLRGDASNSPQKQ